MKLKVKAKTKWSQYHRDIVMASAAFGMKELHLQHVHITIKLVGDHDTNQGAMVSTAPGRFTVWLCPCRNIKTLLETIFHELTHIKQSIYDGWALHDVNDTATWKGKTLHYHEDTNYWGVPWEVEARKFGRKLRRQYTK